MKYFYNTRRTIFLCLGALGWAASAQTIGVNLLAAIATVVPVKPETQPAVHQRVDPLDINLPDAIATEMPVKLETQLAVHQRVDPLDINLPDAIATVVPVEPEVEDERQ